MPQRGPDAVNIDRSAIRLTDAILGFDAQDLGDALEAIASEIGIRHIAYVRFASDKECDSCLSTAVATYSRAWQTRYFVSGYVHSDPVVAHGRKALLPFDWETLGPDDPAILAFFADSIRHGVGRNGLSVPVRTGRGGQALVSFSSDHEKPEWDRFKLGNMIGLQKLAVLIDSAANRNSNLPPDPIRLSQREGQCLTWAARGKTHKEIAHLLDIGFSSVKVHLDVARHKLHCMNLTHAIAVAVATGVIPPHALP